MTILTKKTNSRIISGLSPLESDVIKILWANDKLLVRDIYQKIKNKRKVALTSVAVILDRLYKKKLVVRKVETCRGGTHYIYSAKTTEEDFKKSIMETAVNNMMDTFGSVAVSYFNERFKTRK